MPVTIYASAIEQGAIYQFIFKDKKATIIAVLEGVCEREGFVKVRDIKTGVGRIVELDTVKKIRQVILKTQ